MSYVIIGLGQDGFLAAKALKKENIPFCILTRRSMRLSEILDKNVEIKSHVTYTESIELEDLIKLYRSFKFSNILNFAANSFVQDSRLNFKNYTLSNSNIIWEIIKFLKVEPEVNLFHPLSSEILSSSVSSEFVPRNAYGLSKLIDYHSCRIAGEQENLNIHNCILFNHESIYRPNQFFTKKIIRFLNDKITSEISIYNAKSYRDWGYAPEFIDLILGKKPPKGFKLSQLGTGKLMSVEEFIDCALEVLRITFDKIEKNGLLSWTTQHMKINEISRDVADKDRVVKANPNLVRATFSRIPIISQENLVETLVRDYLS